MVFRFNHITQLGTVSDRRVCLELLTTCHIHDTFTLSSLNTFLVSLINSLIGYLSSDLVI